MTILVAFIIAAIASAVSLLVGVAIGNISGGSRVELLRASMERAVRHLEDAEQVLRPAADRSPELRAATASVIHALNELRDGE